jgi:hypothetical protein
MSHYRPLLMDATRPGGVPPSWPILGRERVRRLEPWSGENLIQLGWCHYRPLLLDATRPAGSLPAGLFLAERGGKKTRELVRKEFNLGKGSHNLPCLINVSSSWAVAQKRESKKTRALVRKEFNPAWLVALRKSSHNLPPLIDVSSKWAILQ